MKLLHGGARTSHPGFTLSYWLAIPGIPQRKKMCDVWPGQWGVGLFPSFYFKFEGTETRCQSIQLATGPIASNYVSVSDNSPWGFPGGVSEVKNPPANAGNSSSIPGSGRFPGEGNGNALQYSCLKNLKNRGAWQATIYGIAKSPTWQK